MELFNMFIQYVVLPVAGVLGLVYQRQQDHHTKLAVLESRLNSDKQAHDREMAEIRETTNKIFAKLDSIEEALRK